MRVVLINLFLVFTLKMTVFGQVDIPHHRQEKFNNELLIGNRSSKKIFKSKRVLEKQVNALDDAYGIVVSRKRSEAIRVLESYKANTRLDTLREIDLSFLGLRKIPDFVFGAKNLEVLVLDYNNIKRLPKELRLLGKMKRLYWRANNLEDVLWIRIAKLNNLEKLDVSKNKLTRLPRGVRRVKELEELVVEECLFDEIPVHRLSKNPSLKTVSFNRNHFPLNLAKGNYDKLDFIEIFKLNNIGLHDIHPSFYLMSGLKELQLQENHISSIPEGIGALQQLQKLSFYKNKLEKIPNDLFGLKNLVAVDFYYNALQVVPEEIGMLINLEILYLSHNKIYTLPESIGNLSLLSELYLHHNRFTALPSAISQLDILETCRVNENYLMEFPIQFLALKQLKDLDLSNNQIKKIPREILNMPSLDLFTMTNNPIDFTDPKNEDIADLLFELSQKGVTVAPKIEKQIVENQ